MARRKSGTPRESWWRDQARARGFRARRYENNAKCRDVDITLADGTELAFEVKDRQNLNGHLVLKEGLATYPQHLYGLLWHRVEKPPGAKKSRPCGPTSVLMPADMALDLLEVVEAAGLLADRGHDPRDRDALINNVDETVAKLRATYPASRPGQVET